MSNIIRILALALLLAGVLMINSCIKNNGEDKQSSAEIKDDDDDDNIQVSNADVFPILNSESAIGNNAADFVWVDNGKEIKFSEYTKGKYVLLNFWGTWCPPCRKEVPDLISIAKEMESKGLVVIGVAMERGHSIDKALRKVSKFWKNHNLTYPVVIGIQDIIDNYGGIEAVPTTFLINNKGEIVESIQGAKSKEEYMAEIQKMMK